MPPELTLGQVQFQQFEVPDEIDHFGGSHRLVRHDFPGGLITLQRFGPFPPRNITWRGSFLAQDVPGATLEQRVDALNQMRVAGQAQALTFGPYQYQVLVHEFRVLPRSQWQQPYVIDLVPFQDLTASGQPGQAQPGTLEQLAQQNADLAGLINASAGLPKQLPAAARTSLSNFQSSLQQAIQQSLGSLSNINVPALQASLQAARTELQQFANATDGSTAQTALRGSAQLGVIGNTLSAQRAPITTSYRAINPNLKALAQQFYGDVRRWTLIAKANKLSNPRPIGVFSLTIPARPA